MPRPKAKFVYSYMREAEKLDAPGFAAAHPEPVLVALTMGDDDKGEYETFAGLSLDAVRGIRKGKRLPPGSEVYPIRKRTDNASSPGMITVGRSSRCDVVIRDAKVSKFHAYLVGDISDPDRWLLADAESRNGTYVIGEQLRPRKLMPLKDGDSVRLGTQVELKFFLPAGFWAAMTG